MTRPTIKDVARRAGVSTTSVSRFLNAKTSNMRLHIRRRIARAIKELDYKPDSRARSLRGLATQIIGVIVPTTSNPFCEELARAIENVCYKEGYCILVCNSQHSTERECRYLDVLQQQRVDGIVLVSSRVDGIVSVSSGIDPEKLNEVVKKGIPIVLTDEDVLGAKVPGVFAKNRIGAAEMTQYLIDIGHKTIAFVTGPSNSLPAQQRLEGVLETLQKNGLHPPNEKIIKKGDYSFEKGYRLTKELLRESAREFTAIFCLNDFMALGAMRAIQEEGADVPNDYSVVGFDNMYFASISNPPLTTVTQPIKEMAAKIFELIKEFNPRKMKRNDYFLDTKLVIRNSCKSLNI